MFIRQGRKGTSCCNCKWLDFFLPGLMMGNGPELTSGIKSVFQYDQSYLEKNSLKYRQIWLCSFASQREFAIKCSLSKVWHTVKREQKERRAPLNHCALGEHVAYEMSQSAVVHAGSPSGCAGCRGCLGDHTANVCSIHPRSAQAEPE